MKRTNVCYTKNSPLPDDVSVEYEKTKVCLSRMADGDWPQFCPATYSVAKQRVFKLHNPQSLSETQEHSNESGIIVGSFEPSWLSVETKEKKKKQSNR